MEGIDVYIRDYQLRIKLPEEVIEDHWQAMLDRFSRDHEREEDRMLFQNTRKIYLEKHIQQEKGNLPMFSDSLRCNHEEEFWKD